MPDTDEITLFVYGTLRHESQGDAHKLYLRDADFLSPAKIRGQLFIVDYYPGLCITEYDEWVKGEIYLLKNNAQLHHIDIYEGCAHSSPQPHEYKREKVAVTLPNNDIVEAWTYLYLGDTTALPKIGTGDFLNPEGYS